MVKIFYNLIEKIKKALVLIGDGHRLLWKESIEEIMKNYSGKVK